MIGIIWPDIVGEYRDIASSEGDTLDMAKLNLSDKNQKWFRLKDTFMF